MSKESLIQEICSMQLQYDEDWNIREKLIGQKCAMQIVDVVKKHMVDASTGNDEDVSGNNAQDFPRPESLDTSTANPSEIRDNSNVDVEALFRAFAASIQKTCNEIFQQNMVSGELKIPEEEIDYWLKYIPTNKPVIGEVRLISAINSLIGYVQALRENDLVTKQYIDRFNSHYVRKVEEQLEEMGIKNVD